MASSFAFLAGVLAVLALPAVPPGWALAALGAAAGSTLLGASVAARRAELGGAMHAVALATCGVAVGAIYTALHAADYMSHRWPRALADERVIAEVTVESIPVMLGDAYSFDGLVRIEAPAPLAGRIRARLISRAPEVVPHAGERWRLLLSLRPPRARVNPGAADLERTLFHDRIHALGTVVSASFNRRLETGHRPLDALRESIAGHIDARVADRDAAALICALAVGVTGSMSREQWRVFNATGTTHLVAISGLHVTLFAAVTFAAARVLWSVLLFRVLSASRDTFAGTLAFAAAAAYATLAGLSVPTQRTLIMLGVWLAVRSLARASAPFHSFALALLAVLVCDPFAPLAPGFWLSFGAMAAIVLVTSTRFAPRSLLAEALVVQAMVTVALIPLTLASFGSVSVVGPLVNLLAIPAMSWVFVPTILLSVVLAPLAPALSDAVLGVAAWMHDVGWPLLAAAADVPWALVHVSPPAWWYGVAAVSVGLSLMPWPTSMRLALVFWTLPLAVAIESPLPEGSVEVTVLDVGEGAAVIRTRRHVLVCDTGDGYGTEGRTAENVLIPFLRHSGLRQVDMLVLSRFSPVTSPGVTALLAALPVTETLVPRAVPDLTGARSCADAPAWEWDGVRFTVLKVEPGLPGAGTCVLSVDSPGGRVLLAGEIDAAAERVLASDQRVRAQIALVPRRGSETGSSAELVHAVGARWAVVSGRRERGGQEKGAVRRWREAGATVLATDDEGAIRFRIDPSTGVEGPRTGRADGRTLWRSSP